MVEYLRYLRFSVHIAKEINAYPCSEQIKLLLREVSPDEYDNAAKYSPSCCPLVLIGDYRSGRQLLADAALDAAQTIESLSHSYAGRAALGGVAGYLEVELAAVKRQLAALECRDYALRTIARGPLQSVQRPLAYHLSALTFDRESPLVDFMGNNQLAQVLVSIPSVFMFDFPPACCVKEGAE